MQRRRRVLAVRLRHCSSARGVGVDVDLRLGSLVLVAVDVVVAPGSGFSSSWPSVTRRRLPCRRCPLHAHGRRLRRLWQRGSGWLACSLEKDSEREWRVVVLLDSGEQGKGMQRCCLSVCAWVCSE